MSDMMAMNTRKRRKMLSPDIYTMIASHTKDMPPKERLTRAISLCHKYSIENEEELKEVAKIADLKMEVLRL
jgi:hypothetical protein